MGTGNSKLYANFGTLLDAKKLDSTPDTRTHRRMCKQASANSAAVFFRNHQMQTKIRNPLLTSVRGSQLLFSKSVRHLDPRL